MSRALTAPCDGCGNPNGVLVWSGPNFGEYHCKDCTRRMALYNAAQDQLELLLREAVRAWLPIWGDLPGVVDLGEQFRQIGPKLYDEWKAGKLDAEDVQPVQVLSNAAD